MKLLIVGHSVVDRINYKGNKELKPGGIFYSTIALRYLAEQDNEIFLCSSMCKKDEYLFKDIYEIVITSYSIHYTKLYDEDSSMEQDGDPVEFVDVGKLCQIDPTGISREPFQIHASLAPTAH